MERARQCTVKKRRARVAVSSAAHRLRILKVGERWQVEGTGSLRGERSSGAREDAAPRRRGHRGHTQRRGRRQEAHDEKLPHCSMLAITAQQNVEYAHCVPKEDSEGERWSLIFRTIKSATQSTKKRKATRESVWKGLRPRTGGAL